MPLSLFVSSPGRCCSILPRCTGLGVDVHWILGLFLNEKALCSTTQVATLSSKVKWAPEMEKIPESRTVVHSILNIDSLAEKGADVNFTESPNMGTGLNNWHFIVI